MDSMVLNSSPLLSKLKYCVIYTQNLSSLNVSMAWVLYSTILVFTELKSKLVTYSIKLEFIELEYYVNLKLPF